MQRFFAEVADGKAVKFGSGSQNKIACYKKPRVCGAFAWGLAGLFVPGQFGHGDAGEKAGAGFVAGVAGHEIVDLFDQEVGQGDVDLMAFAQVRGHVDIDNGPDPAGEVGVVHMVFDGRGFGDGVAALDRDFQPAIDGFFGVGQGVFEGVACGVAAG